MLFVAESHTSYCDVVELSLQKMELNFEDNRNSCDSDVIEDARRSQIADGDDEDGLNYDDPIIWEQVVMLAENELAKMGDVVDDPEAIEAPLLPPHLSRIMVGSCFSSMEEFKSALHDEVIIKL